MNESIAIGSEIEYEILRIECGINGNDDNDNNKNENKHKIIIVVIIYILIMITMIIMIMINRIWCNGNRYIIRFLYVSKVM